MNTILTGVLFFSGLALTVTVILHIAAQKTLQLMQGKELEVTHEIYPVTLVVRNSTSAIG